MNPLHRLHDWWRHTTTPRRHDLYIPLELVTLEGIPDGGYIIVETGRGVRIALIGSIPGPVVADWLGWVNELPEVER